MHSIGDEQIGHSQRVRPGRTCRRRQGGRSRQRLQPRQRERNTKPLEGGTTGHLEGAGHYLSSFASRNMNGSLVTIPVTRLLKRKSSSASFFRMLSTAQRS